MKILTVIGNRPQFIKAAAVSPLLRERGQELLVHTGQHHDDRLSAVFFAELGIPAPEVQLAIAGGSNSSQTGRMLAALEPVMAAARPDCVLVYGDTNSTLAGALAATQQGLPVAHVEAGMRSFDRSMPEEVNRVLTDHLSTLLLCSSDVAVTNLEREGIGTAAGPLAGGGVERVADVIQGADATVGRVGPAVELVGDPIRGGAPAVELVGDVMVDVALAAQPRARERTDLVRAHGLTPGEYLLATAHRVANVDDPRRLMAMVRMLRGLELPVVLPLHPRTRARLEAAGLLGWLAGGGRVRLTEPLGYLELTALLVSARAVLTDSGGLQKEAYLAGVPCLTMRPATEWVETVEAGWNTLVDLDPEAVAAALAAPLPRRRPPLYGDGQAGARVVEALERAFG